jgi:hypothetical protein
MAVVLRECLSEPVESADRLTDTEVDVFLNASAWNLQCRRSARSEACHVTAACWMP